MRRVFDPLAEQTERDGDDPQAERRCGRRKDESFQEQL